MAEWIVKRGDVQRTVQDLETLRAYAQSGRLRPDDLVRGPESSQWVKVEDLPELAFIETPTPTSPASHSRGFQPKLIGLTITALVAVLVLVAFWMWTRSPQYAIRQIQAAIKLHDLQKFRKYVDVDGVSADVLVLVQSNVSHSGSLASAVATTMSSSLQDTLKHSLTNMVESQDSGAPRIVYEYIEIDSTYSGIEYVRRDGKLALVGLKFTSSSNDASVFEIRMRDLGSHWQVAGLNISQIVEVKRVRDANELARIEKLRRQKAQAVAEKHRAEASKAAHSLRLSLNTSEVVGGVVGGAQNLVSATLALPDPAFAYITVAVSSDSTVVSVPSFVTISEGTTSENFIVTPSRVEKPERVTIHADAHGVRRSVELTVNPPEEHDYTIFESVYFDPVAREFHVSTCPTAKGRKLFTSYQAMISQRVPRAKDCASLSVPRTTLKSREP